MRIAICEDSQADRILLTDFCEKYARLRSIVLETALYESADLLLEDGALCFVTVSEDFYAEGFEVGALHYLIKPITYEAFDEAMNRAARTAGTLERHIRDSSNAIEAVLSTWNKWRGWRKMIFC